MLRYDYNFAALGLPGLTFNVRYVKGDQVDPQRIASAMGRALAAQGGKGRSGSGPRISATWCNRGH